MMSIIPVLQCYECTHAAVGGSDTGGLLERVAVGGDADSDLARGGAGTGEVLDSLVSRDVCACAAVQVSLIVGLRIGWQSVA